MAFDYYQINFSPPCRAVLMTIRHLNIDANIKLVDLRTGEHLKEHFLKINPEHTVPTIVENGWSLWESRAIMQYLVNRYSPGHSLYPLDPQQRAIVDRLLQFDLGSLYYSGRDWMFPQLFARAAPDAEKEKKLTDNFNFLEGFLEGNKYVTGDTLTLADFSILATVTNLQTFGFDTSKYKNVNAWLDRLASELPYYNETTTEACKSLKEVFDTVMGKK